MALHEQINVWRRAGEGRVCRYTCFRVFETGRYWVQSADFLTPDSVESVAKQTRIHDYEFLDLFSEDEEPSTTYETLEAAIGAHDAEFENELS